MKKILSLGEHFLKGMIVLIFSFTLIYGVSFADELSNYYYQLSKMQKECSKNAREARNLASKANDAYKSTKNHGFVRAEKKAYAAANDFDRAKTHFRDACFNMTSAFGSIDREKIGRNLGTIESEVNRATRYYDEAISEYKSAVSYYNSSIK